MFKFNFESSECDNNITEIAETTKIKWFESKEIPYKLEYNYDDHLKTNESLLLNVTIGNCNIKHFSPGEIVKIIGESDNLILKTEQDHSDLITALYEGGLKIWNGTFDLLEYFHKENIDFRDKRVLDLGCGNGLMGIYCLLNGAEVVFQDYNDEVIKYITIPNVNINVGLNAKCRFFSGDWESFLQDNKDFDKFDYIVTADTIYNLDSYDKIHSIFVNLLKIEGTIFLAAKTIYFGLSGSIQNFEALLCEKQVLSSRNVHSIMEGIQREILEIKFKVKK